MLGQLPAHHGPVPHEISHHGVHCYRGINQVPFKLIPSWTIREGFVKEVTIDIVDKY